MQEAIPAADPRRRARARGARRSVAPRWRSPSSATAAAEVHRRGRRAAGASSLPGPGQHRGRRSTTVEVGDEEIDEQVDGAARALRHPQDRRARRRRTATSSRSTWPPPSTARRSPAARRPTSPTRWAASSSCPGLDEVLVGMTAGADATFNTQLVGGDYAGRDAEVSVTVRTVKERRCPPSTTSSPSWPASSTRWRSCAATWHERLARVKKVEQLYAARDKALAALVAARRRPGAGGRGARGGRAAASRRWSTSSSAWAPPSRSTSSAEEQDRGADRHRADRRGHRGRQDPAAARHPRRGGGASRSPTTSSATRSCTGRSAPACSPQQYYDQLVRSGAAAAVFGDVRRGKALAPGHGAGDDQRHRRRRRSRLDELRGGPRRATGTTTMTARATTTEP